MNAIELFAGAGGAALGLHRAGIHHVALAEWNPQACATLRAAIAAGHFDADEVIEGDIREVDWSGRSADLLWSSFPCQGWSTAGKRLGAKDPRNGWPWTVDVIDAIRPAWFVAENVPGLLTHSEEGHPNPDECPACYEAAVIMPQLRARFAWVGRWELDAADFGTPQRRHRVFWVAGPHPIAPPQATHADPAILRQVAIFERRKPWVTAGEALGLSGMATFDLDAPIGAITCHDGKVSPRGQGAKFVLQRLPPPSSAAGNVPWPSTTPAMTVGTNGLSIHLNKPCPTLSAQPSGPNGQDGWMYEYTGRRLTPTECAALFDMPPDYPWTGPKQAVYRQIGNMVACRVAEAVGRAVRLGMGA